MPLQRLLQVLQTCEQCKLQYIGQTTRSLDERVRDHIGYIRNLHTNHTNQPTGVHFNLPGHELYYLKVSVLEKVYKLKSLFLIFMTETISRNNNFLKLLSLELTRVNPENVDLIFFWFGPSPSQNFKSK